MTDHDKAAARREITDALQKALDRRHEVLDVIVEADNKAAAVDAIAKLLGTSHAGGNPLTVVDWAGAITAWVEKGQAPTQLTVNLPKASPARTLPVCPYTAYPQYSGSGDVNSAASYRCVDNAP